MNKFLHIFITEIREHLNWFLAWMIGINSYVLMAIFIYPGEDALQGFLGLLDDPYFAAFLGNIGGQNPSYTLWIGLLLPFISIAIFIFALMFGVRVSSKSISDETGELVHTMPLPRYQILIVRWFITVIGGVLLFGIIAIFLSIPFLGETVDLNRLWILSWWGMIFYLFVLSLGMVIGLISADTGRGNQISLFLSLFLYALQITGRLVTELEDINELNPLTWYTPEQAILTNEIADGIVLKIVFGLIIFSTLAILVFKERDLIVNAPLTVPILSNLKEFIKTLRNGGSKDRLMQKSDKDSIFTRWARPLEKRFPFTADFIYSERMVILIMFWAIIMFYPGQLLIYDPNDQEFIEGLQGTIDSFGNTGIMKVFTYGHDISNNLFLWLLITQAIGLHYFFFVPLTAHWIKKILLSDTDNDTGELMASVPVKEHKVLLQRLFAVFLEMIVIVLMMVFWLLISETIIGESVSQFWEIMAIVSYIPLYIFLLTAGLSIGLLFEKGIQVARYGLLFLILVFISAILVEDIEYIKPFTGFGLYDPVLIITDQSLSVVNYGVFILIGLAVFSTLLIYLLSTRYKWVRVSEHGSSPLFHEEG